jgi:hypothetical protein
VNKERFFPLFGVGAMALCMTYLTFISLLLTYVLCTLTQTLEPYIEPKLSGAHVFYPRLAFIWHWRKKADTYPDLANTL